MKSMMSETERKIIKGTVDVGDTLRLALTVTVLPGVPADAEAPEPAAAAACPHTIRGTESESNSRASGSAVVPFMIGSFPAVGLSKLKIIFFTKQYCLLYVQILPIWLAKCSRWFRPGCRLDGSKDRARWQGRGRFPFLWSLSYCVL
jgi:hypothetical protein